MLFEILITLIALSISIVGAAAIASAQTAETRMSAQIPFDFMDGEQTLHAGTYELRRLGNDRYLLCVQNLEDIPTFLKFVGILVLIGTDNFKRARDTNVNTQTPRILITGATGNIGTELAKVLSARKVPFQ